MTIRNLSWVRLTEVGKLLFFISRSLTYALGILGCCFITWATTLLRLHWHCNTSIWCAARGLPPHPRAPTGALPSRLWCVLPESGAGHETTSHSGTACRQCTHEDLSPLSLEATKDSQTLLEHQCYHVLPVVSVTLSLRLQDFHIVQ